MIMHSKHKMFPLISVRKPRLRDADLGDGGPVRAELPHRRPTRTLLQHCLERRLHYVQGMYFVKYVINEINLANCSGT